MNGAGRRRESNVLMGRWKAAVSRKQRARKKRYCKMIGWEERKALKGVFWCMFAEFSKVLFPEAVELLLMLAERGVSGSGSGGEREVEV